MGKLFLFFTFLSFIALGLGTPRVSCETVKSSFYELKKGNFSVKVTNQGAAVVSVLLPDRYGKLADVVLGYDRAEDYKNNTPNFGATVGRVANRIKGAKFYLNRTLYRLVPNDGKNTLHGGPKGFGNITWNVKKISKRSANPYIIFSHYSSDGEQGFPGALAVTVKYMLIGDYTLSITMKAEAFNKATPVNLAHHTYWNLAGHNTGDILDNVVQIFGSKITELDKELIPTGKFKPVKGTPYDYLQPGSIASKIKKLPNGYDINYVLDEDRKALKLNARVYEEGSGRVMEVLADQPGVQFYTSNTLKGVVGKGGYVYQPYAALCLESQGFPDAVHHPKFPSTVVKPGRVYKHLMQFKFSTRRSEKQAW